MEESEQVPIDLESGRERPMNPFDALEDEMDGLPLLSPDCCIYKVPERLRCVNEKAYTPKVVSIGPLHHGKDSFKAMEKHKKRYLQSFLCRTSKSLKYYIERIESQKERLRSCYEVEDTGFTSEEFVRIILVDAAFIIELLLRLSESDEVDRKNDRIFNKPGMIRDIAFDMFLLENQLPFFILEDLYDPDKTAVSSSKSRNADSAETEKPSIIDLFYIFLERAAPIQFTISGRYEVEHFLDLVRTLHLPEPKNSGGGSQLKSLIIPSITELHLAGVKLKAGSSKKAFDIRFIDGTLEIPPVPIQDHSELIFRNLVAFEQCHFDEYYWSAYIFILDKFVNTSKDVELLAKNGILENWLGDTNEVSTLINRLCNGVIHDLQNFYYATICEDLNKYCKMRRHKWKASLRQKYFNTPWAAISVIAAVVLLILTFIQTVCSIISAT